MPVWCRLAEQRQEVQRLRSAELLRLGFVMALAMTLHNLPEGFAVRLKSSYSTDAPQYPHQPILP